MSKKPKAAVVDAVFAVALDADLRIGAAPVLRDRLREALGAGRGVAVDGATVAQVDTAALQLLAAFARDAAGAGIAVAWSASDVLRKGVEGLGLKETIELPVA
jgi:phospholipid transport system transporter-binding protein